MRQFEPKKRLVVLKLGNIEIGFEFHVGRVVP
jgi:hypothetical protein